MWYLSYTVRREFDMAGASIDLERGHGGAVRCFVRKTQVLGARESPPIAVAVSDAQADAIHAQLLNAKFDLLPDPRGGFGGTWHELEVAAGAFDRIVFHWWLDLPSEWVGLAPLVVSLSAILVSTIDAQPGAAG